MVLTSLTTHFPFRRTAGLALVSLATLACSSGTSDAQGPTPRSERRAPIKTYFDPQAHALDEATARKVIAVMRAWTPPEPKAPKELQESGDIVGAMKYVLENAFTMVAARELTEQNSTATIDGSPLLVAAVHGQGLSSREFAKALITFQIATLDIGLRDMAAANGITHPRELVGVHKANTDLVRKLTAEGAIPSGWF